MLDVGGFEVKILTLNRISQKFDVFSGISTNGLGANCRSLVAEPPAGKLLVQATPPQVVLMVPSPSYPTRLPASVQGRPELEQSSSKCRSFTVSVSPPEMAPAPSCCLT